MMPHPPHPKATRTALALGLGGLVLFLAAIPASAAGDDAVITVVFTADDMGFNATSSKDLSNVIVELCNGTLVKYDGLTGHSFVDTEAQKIASVYVKSGNNGIEGNQPPGAGQRFFNAGVECSETSSSTSDTSTSSTDTSTSDTGTSTSDTETTTHNEIPFFPTGAALGLGVAGALGAGLLLVRRKL